MEMDQIIKLVNTVSSSKLTEFSYMENGVEISMKKENEKVILTDSSQIKQVSVPSVSVEEKPEEIQGNVVKSPLVGTFYAAPAEDAEPFVQVGDHVKKGQTLAIVEAMKLMNDIESEWDGVITQILVENGQSVEYGQELFVIE